MSAIGHKDSDAEIGRRANRVAAIFSVGLSRFAAAGCVAALGLLLYSACCAFTWKNFLMSDYGVYTNTIWNLGRGNGFTFLIDHDYLTTHLSFSLWFLGPLFYLWNHPMLLLLVQWLFLVGGAFILLALARRCLIPPVLTSAILLFFCTYPWTQGVMLSEFHGVSAYFLLIPWLVYCLSFHKSLVILPLALTLGLREDAGLLLPLVFVYFAVRDRWKAGYAYAAVSVAYSVLAITCLYPLINGRELFDVRMHEGEALKFLDSLKTEGLHARLRATFWTILPALPFFLFTRGGWKAMTFLPATAYLIAMFSGIPRQYALRFHYPAALAALTAAAMVLAASHPRSGRPVRTILPALFLCALTGIAYVVNGHLPGGSNSHRDYRTPQADGLVTLNLARDIPGDGTLVCNQHLAAFAANRKQVVTWRYWKRDQHSADLFFCRLLEFADPSKSELAEGLRNGALGVRAMAFPYFVLQKGLRSDLNADVIRMLDARMLAVGTMAKGGGANRVVPGVGLVRYWKGNGHKAPLPLAHGTFLALDPGAYTATFEYRAAPPRRAVLNSWGWFSVWERGKATPVARVKIDKSATATDAFIKQSFSLELNAPARVEPRVEAGDAELWVLSVSFERITPGKSGSPDTQPHQAAGLIDHKGDSVGEERQSDAL